MEHRGGSQSHGLIPTFEEGRSRGPTVFLELLLGCSLVQRVRRVSLAPSACCLVQVAGDGVGLVSVNVPSSLKTFLPYLPEVKSMRVEVPHDSGPLGPEVQSHGTLGSPSRACACV